MILSADESKWRQVSNISRWWLEDRGKWATREPAEMEDIRRLGAPLFTSGPAMVTSRSYFSTIGKLWLSLTPEQKIYWEECLAVAKTQLYKVPKGEATGRCVEKLLKYQNEGLKEQGTHSKWPKEQGSLLERQPGAVELPCGAGPTSTPAGADSSVRRRISILGIHCAPCARGS